MLETFFDEVLVKKGLRHFLVNFAKFLRTPFLKNSSDGCFLTLINFHQGIPSFLIIKLFSLRDNVSFDDFDDDDDDDDDDDEMYYENTSGSHVTIRSGYRQ